MNIEKVKEALSMASFELPELSSAPNGKEPHAIKASRLVKEAIAELEKPDDRDAFDCAIRVLAFNPSTTNATGKLADIIQQYAESYHAKKCAECVDRSAPRFPESRSGVTTDVDK